MSVCTCVYVCAPACVCVCVCVWADGHLCICLPSSGDLCLLFGELPAVTASPTIMHAHTNTHTNTYFPLGEISRCCLTSTSERDGEMFSFFFVRNSKVSNLPLYALQS